MIRFVAENNPVHRVNERVRTRLVAAQNEMLESVFSDAKAFCEAVFDDLRISVTAPNSLAGAPPSFVSDQPFPHLIEYFTTLLQAASVDEHSARIHAANLAQRTHLVRAFPDPDEAVGFVTEKVRTIVQRFPKRASDIERGRNPGDVLDPYILAATQMLLYGGDFQGAIGATVAHKALMIIEGLMGHLHEEVIGHMRGNVRAPEPKKEEIDVEDNPFPGADVVQPPRKDGDGMRFHQIKSKTGSAKGGDGRRLGEQLRRLRLYYGGEVFYDALIGNTLRGHRSMRGVLTAEPRTVVLVGEAAFEELTNSSIGPELLLRVYTGAFSNVARQEGYHINTMAEGIVTTFQARADTAGDDFLDQLLSKSIRSNRDEQDSRVYQPPTRGSRSARRK
ncbi:MAG: hypothetical protein F4Y67_04350 [Chloroflexi bacterium]|nr:hypothetical protein [Chloroflexota bacterium]MYG37421.1 hypothetical protein [Gemmatimonadota bacterium]